MSNINYIFIIVRLPKYVLNCVFHLQLIRNSYLTTEYRRDTLGEIQLCTPWR